jgi:hypothetical protein
MWDHVTEFQELKTTMHKLSLCKQELPLLVSSHVFRDGQSLSSEESGLILGEVPIRGRSIFVNSCWAPQTIPDTSCSSDPLWASGAWYQQNLQRGAKSLREFSHTAKDQSSVLTDEPLDTKAWVSFPVNSHKSGQRGHREKTIEAPSLNL